MGSLAQKSLFRRSNPLALRFDTEFFRVIPQSPGVYEMRNEAGEIIYIGKAKCLRDRLRSYCHVHSMPDVSRKTIRLLHDVRQIRWTLTATEKEALLLESELLGLHQPRYNVIIPRPEFYDFIAVIENEGNFALRLKPWNGLREKNQPLLYGAFRGRRRVRRAVLALSRLLYLSGRQLEHSMQLPGRLQRDWVPQGEDVALPLQSSIEATLFRRHLLKFFQGRSKRLISYVRDTFHSENFGTKFWASMIQSDVEALEEFYKKGPKRLCEIRKFYGLRQVRISCEDLDHYLTAFPFDAST